MKETPIFTINAKYLGMKFEQLVKKYPYLKRFIASSNPPRFDLGDPITLSEINKCLFKELGELEIAVPSNYLIPAYSLRAAYVQVINNLIKNDRPIIEIGTGTSAAIAMIFAKKYGKKVFATEINSVSYESAKRNIERNKLTKLITLLKSEGEILKKLIPKGKYSALLVYPPIYPNDLTKLKKQRGWKGVKSELIAGKEELEFCNQLLTEYIECTEIEIDLLSIQVMNLKQLKMLDNNFQSKGKCNFALVKVGIRRRYIFLFSKKI